MWRGKWKFDCGKVPKGPIWSFLRAHFVKNEQIDEIVVMKLVLRLSPNTLMFAMWENDL